MAESSNQPVDRDWYAKQDVIVADQAVGLPEVGSFNLYKLTPPLKERTDFDNWIDQVEKVLRSHKLHNLINTDILQPAVNDPNGEKWHTLSLQVRTWMTSSMDHTLVQEINARGSKIGFADDFLTELKKYIKGEGHGALKAAIRSFKKLSRSQFTTNEEFIYTVKLRYKAICDLNRELPLYYALETMLLELSDIPELSGFIVVKDNELNAIEKPAKTITIIDFYRYSTAILDYVKSSNTDSLALSALKKRITNLSGSPPTPATNSNTTNNNNTLTNKPPKGVSAEEYIRKWLAHKLERSDNGNCSYCGKRHRVSRCFYLYPELRYLGWILSLGLWIYKKTTISAPNVASNSTEFK